MKRKIPLILLCILFLGMTGYAGVRMYRVWREYRIHEQAYGSLARYVQLEKPSTEGEDASMLEAAILSQTHGAMEQMTEENSKNWPVVDFQALKEINPDIVAWIYMEGTPIHYPVLQGEDNNQYLERLYDGRYNAAGSIFMDYRNQEDLSDRHLILYGHHMKNDTMLACITEYKEQSFYDAHPSCLILTPEGNYEVAFIAGYVTDRDSDAWKLVFASDEEYALWLEEAVSKSTFISNVEPTPQDRVVTFSTCSYEFPDARYVLVGILK